MIMKGGLFIIYIASLILRSCKCQKFHIVHRGPCLNRESDFCHFQVPNSFCSQTANECFCKNGYASIKEFSRIVCKSLLTDIICRGDHHCTHVKDSICHPGAMRCTCPAETIYVPQHHACMTKYVGQSSETCAMCRSNGGDCFIDKSNLRELNVLCRCPNNRINIYSLPSVSQPLPICWGLAVDVGQYCDNKKILCKSKLAKCVENHTGLNTCQCPPGHIPIYQEQLDYFECFHKADFDESKACKVCRSLEGQCFLREGYGNKYGCKCSNIEPNIFLSIKNKNYNISSRSCLSKHVSISCWSNSITVCLTLKNIAHAERIRHGISFSFVGTEQSNAHNFSSDCILSPPPELDNKSDFCTNIRIDSSRKMPCGMNSIRYMDGILYKGQVQFWSNKYTRDVAKDLQIDFSCKNKRNQYKGMTGNTIDRSLSLDSSTPSSNFRRTKLEIKTLSGDVANVIKKDDVLQMEITLDKSEETFQSINVEKCSLEAFSTQSSSNRSKINLLISSPQECVRSQNNTFQKLSWNRMNPSSWKKIKSEFFTLHNINIEPNTNVRIYCVYIICKERRQCKKDVLCSEVQNSASSWKGSVTWGNISSPMILVMSRVEFNFVSDPINHVFAPRPKITKVCDESICLTDTHMWMISFFCLICIITLTSFIICLWKKIHNRSTLNYESPYNKPDILLQNEITFMNKLPEISNFHHSLSVINDEKNKYISSPQTPTIHSTFISNSLNNSIFRNPQTDKETSENTDLDAVELYVDGPHYGHQNKNFSEHPQYHIMNSTDNTLLCHCNEDQTA